MALITINKAAPPTLTASDLDVRFYRRVFFFIIATVMAYIFCVSFLKVPEENKAYVNVILGFVLGSGLGTLIGWRWGTAKSSEDKTRTIDAQIRNVAVPIAPPPPAPGADVQPGAISTVVGTLTGKDAP